ncbi:gliding motility-associated lipoprotein GldH [Mucilaginibacter paludis DSM 18603]|uniref:Gliding motility-associated lipoprotein GldH n=2 Tax=Mucilaginibacter TaxID=423349 RepID=H1YG55_9SPHI|nr:gliding motility-associated lipoprotein GldH [Mucilaginibacter paludis DSM 18603]
MNQAFKTIVVCMAVCTILFINGCNIKDQKMIVDQNIEIDNQNWSYNNKVNTDFTIDDAALPYNLYLNLRVTPDYKYSNIFVLIHQTGPDKKTITTRYEFTLANKDGEWLGQGTGNLYNYQVPFKTNYKFPEKGKYHISIEQNMRDNPLHQVSDAGLRVEKAE